MKVIVDTCVWSLALRNKPIQKKSQLTQQLANLINDFRVQMIGPIRQELLSGISTSDQLDKLKKNLEAFSDLPITTKDHEQAAVFFNICRKKGIQGSHTDFLICALAAKHGMLIFTTDNDFYNYKKFLAIELFASEPG